MPEAFFKLPQFRAADTRSMLSSTGQSKIKCALAMDLSRLTAAKCGGTKQGEAGLNTLWRRDASASAGEGQRRRHGFADAGRREIYWMAAMIASGLFCRNAAKVR
jgi:hypothetical protein